MSNSQKTPDDYIKEALTRSAQARAEGATGEALVWLGTAAILDSDADRADPCSPVNTALFQLAYDAAYDSERRVLKCGNVTTESGKRLAFGRDAAAILCTRLDGKAPEAARSLAVVLKGHFDALFRRFRRHYADHDGSIYVPTSGADAKFCLETNKAIRALIDGYEGLTIEKPRNFERDRAILLHICVTSPDYEVQGRLLRFLSAWDKALFFIEGAQYLLNEVKAMPGLQTAEKTRVATDLAAALERARQLTLQENQSAKQSYRAMTDLCKALIGSQRDVPLDF
ncbi:MAG: hypothetical protein JSS83_14735 [Cyanobacteria bacterium SZAS LIN-3]|nr:hypothetical protein [Cyanobacteria bacterium SZAS LIN-3]